MKIWLCAILDDRREDNIKAMTETWEGFDGLGIVLHKQGGRPEVEDLLRSRLKDGFIVSPPYQFHNGHAMNHFLFHPKIKLNDWIVLRDDSERLTSKFVNNLPLIIQRLGSSGIGTVFQYSKVLMFRRWFNQQFLNGLHWGLSGAIPGYLAIDQHPDFKNDRDYAYSVRNETRPKDHRYLHEARYLIDYGPNGNHLVLFWQDPKELAFHQEEFARFLAMLERLGVCSVGKWGKYLKSKPLGPEMKYFINLERPLRNYYRYYILGHSNEEILKDEDTWRIP